MTKKPHFPQTLIQLTTMTAPGQRHHMSCHSTICPEADRCVIQVWEKIPRMSTIMSLGAHYNVIYWHCDILALQAQSKRFIGLIPSYNSPRTIHLSRFDMCYLSVCFIFLSRLNIVHLVSIWLASLRVRLFQCTGNSRQIYKLWYLVHDSNAV